MGINISSWPQNTKVKEWRSDNKYDNASEDDIIAGPLKAPYTPDSIAINGSYGNLTQSRNIIPNGKFMITSHSPFNTFLSHPEERMLISSSSRCTGRYIQTHSLFQSVNNFNQEGMCPVSVNTTRHLAPVKVGTGVILSRVVDLLQNNTTPQLSRASKFLSLPSTPLSNRFLPKTPTHSPCSDSLVSESPLRDRFINYKTLSEEEFDESELLVEVPMSPNKNFQGNIRTLTRSKY